MIPVLPVGEHFLCVGCLGLPGDPRSLDLSLLPASLLVILALPGGENSLRVGWLRCPGAPRSSDLSRLTVALSPPTSPQVSTIGTAVGL